jgi:hypothetical protein
MKIININEPDIERLIKERWNIIYSEDISVTDKNVKWKKYIESMKNAGLIKYDEYLSYLTNEWKFD